MGFLPDPTKEMGEYSVEIRTSHGTFYLHGEDPYDHVHEGAKRPRHALTLYVERKPLGDDEGRMMDEVEYERAVWVVDHGQPDDPVVQTAFKMLIEDGRAWKARAIEESRRVTTCGMVEFLIEDIPKLRAALDQVEELRR